MSIKTIQKCRLNLFKKSNRIIKNCGWKLNVPKFESMLVRLSTIWIILFEIVAVELRLILEFEFLNPSRIGFDVPIISSNVVQMRSFLFRTIFSF